jgi:hypothetical protein
VGKLKKPVAGREMVPTFHLISPLTAGALVVLPPNLYATTHIEYYCDLNSKYYQYLWHKHALFSLSLLFSNFLFYFTFFFLSKKHVKERQKSFTMEAGIIIQQ